MKNFSQDGYFAVKSTFDASELDAVQAAYRNMLVSPPPGVGVIYEPDGVTVRSVMGWQRGRGALGMFARDPRFMKYVRKLLGTEVEYHQTKWNPKAGGGKGEKWDPHRGDTYWCWKDGVPNPEGLLSVFIAVTEQTEENGAVWVWKGSHVVGLEEMRQSMSGVSEEENLADTGSELSMQISPEKLAEFDRRFERVMLTGSAGSVWILHSGLLHASRNNNSENTRSLVANVYRSSGNNPTHPRPHNYLCEPPGSVVP